LKKYHLATLMAWLFFIKASDQKFLDEILIRYFVDSVICISEGHYFGKNTDTGEPLWFSGKSDEKINDHQKIQGSLPSPDNVKICWQWLFSLVLF
jgi:hypothetical protein